MQLEDSPMKDSVDAGYKKPLLLAVKKSPKQAILEPICDSEKIDSIDGDKNTQQINELNGLTELST